MDIAAHCHTDHTDRVCRAGCCGLDAVGYRAAQLCVAMRLQGSMRGTSVRGSAGRAYWRTCELATLKELWGAGSGCAGGGVAHA